MSGEEEHVLTTDQLINLCANVWEEGYRANRGPCDQALARLLNPYIRSREEPD